MLYRIIFFLISISLIILIDLYSKNLALTYLNTNSVNIFYDIISLKLTYNYGIAFSFPIQGILLKLITIGLILIIFSYYCIIEFKKNNLILDYAFILILGGALGNGYDRVINGKVVDFISVKYFSIFNLADSFIFLGVILYFGIEFLSGFKKNK